MEWEQGSRQTNLSRLGELTGRLLKLVAFKKMKDHESVLRQNGIESDICADFLKTHIHAQSKKYSKNESIYVQAVRVVDSEDSTF